MGLLDETESEPMPARRKTDRKYGHICASVTALWDWIDRRQVIRRVAFFWIMWLTIEVLFWTMNFASTSPRPGLDVAAIIAAIWTPLGLLQGAIFKFYDEGRKQDQS